MNGYAYRYNRHKSAILPASLKNGIRNALRRLFPEINEKDKKNAF